MSKLSNVSSQYGAPMGRGGLHCANTEAPLVVTIDSIYIDNSGYDNGGAYWGTGKPLWRATAYDADDTDQEIVLKTFFRASDLEAARATVLKDYPNATWADRSLINAYLYRY